jgi:hypothetical protein
MIFSSFRRFFKIAVFRVNIKCSLRGTDDENDDNDAIFSNSFLQRAQHAWLFLWIDIYKTISKGDIISIIGHGQRECVGGGATDCCLLLWVVRARYTGRRQNVTSFLNL